MRLKIIVNELQIEDMAPTDEEFRILRDECCKIGETVSPALSVETSFNSLKIPDKKEKSVRLIKDTEYSITGEILAGVLGDINSRGRVYLIIDCGILLRVSTNDPIEYEVIEDDDGCKRRVPIKKDNMKKFVFRKHDFISFIGKIKAMWLDTWESIVYTNSNCIIVDKIDKGEEGLVLTVECSFPEKPLIEIDSYLAKHKPKIWEDSTEFTLEY